MHIVDFSRHCLLETTVFFQRLASHLDPISTHAKRIQDKQDLAISSAASESIVAVIAAEAAKEPVRGQVGGTETGTASEDEAAIVGAHRRR